MRETAKYSSTVVQILHGIYNLINQYKWSVTGSTLHLVLEGWGIVGNINSQKGFAISSANLYHLGTFQLFIRGFCLFLICGIGKMK